MDSQLSKGTNEWLQEHLETIRHQIISRANALAQQDKRAVEPRDIAEAAKKFAPGTEVVRTSVYERVFSWTPSITTVSAVLAVVFGVIGWRGANASAFDIAKV